MYDERKHPVDPGTSELTRRDFLKTTAAGVAAASTSSLSLMAQDPGAQRGSAETSVAQLYGTLTEKQKETVAFPFDHPLRQRVDNNWRVTEARVGTFFDADQQAMIREIFMGLHSPEYAERVMAQVEDDNRSFGRCAVALFGEPGSGEFEFVLSGRHVTRRCDGDSVEGAAFGGPIFYGHAAESFNEKADHPGNAYWFQAVRANEVFQALDGKQRELALLAEPRRERGSKTVELSGKKTGLPGIRAAELSSDQKELVRSVVADLLAPFREADAKECTKLIDAGGFDDLHLAFYKNSDIGDDGVWDVWQIEGPSMLWFFRGAPHVHTWVHIREPRDKAPFIPF